MKLATAQQLANKVIESMRPFCDRVEVAGSIRRRKAEVRDLELVAIPKLGEPIDLLGEERENLLYRWARQVEAEERILWLKPNVEGAVRWPLDPKGKYWRGLLVKAEIKLDLFLTTPEQWGVIYLIRTGSAEYAARIVSECRPAHYFAEGKLIDRNGNVIPTPEESDVYDALGIPFVPPEHRH